ncbi:hypothetical protein NDU88_000844 [Pleurodeles waltl]|uniref:Uncharacterized protein n=1 Tax=Pleurodeles waltl TaxID=8319 RepID=A0AAV7VX69_PLEWA|nr:hypothetical protein NDU88_000844 [Pleurodeles waltl]
MVLAFLDIEIDPVNMEWLGAGLDKRVPSTPEAAEEEGTDAPRIHCCSLVRAPEVQKVCGASEPFSTCWV